MKYLRYLVFCILFLFPLPVSASDFVDNFNSIDSLDNYTVNYNGGTVSVDSGVLRLSAPFGNKQYPFLTFKNLNIVLPYTSVEIVFKYETVGKFGSGISVENYLPINGMAYDIGHNSLLWTWNWGSPPKSRFGYYSFNYQDLIPQTDFHKIVISGVPGSYLIFLDDIYVNTITSTKPLNSLWVGNPEVVGTNDSWPTLVIDSIKIADSSIPAPTFPYISQLDPLWAGVEHEYDTASQWAGEGQRGIDRWGCALTSTAMLLQDYDVKTPTGETITPINLNTWLKTQPDGYIGSGLLNWLAVTRFINESYEAGNSPTKLEYSRTYTSNPVDRPVILGMPGHFVVAYGEDSEDWQVVDPTNVLVTTLPKTTTITSFNHFFPTLTDLSYLLFMFGDSTTAVLTNELGEIVPIDWLPQYLRDPIGNVDSPSVVTGMVAKPKSGKYFLNVTQGEGETDDLYVLMYDDHAKLTKSEFELREIETRFEIQYASESGQVSSMKLLDTTPPQTPNVISPPSGAYVNTAGLVLDWSDVTDESMPVTYKYKSSWSGGSYGPVGTGSNSYINAPGTPDNLYLWQVQACDSVGNCSAWSSSQLYVDSTKPSSVSILSPDEGAYLRSSPIANKWSMASDNFGVDYYRVEYKYEDGHTFSGFPYRITTSTSRNHSPSLAEQGGVSYRVQAFDKAGNEGPWSQWRYYVYDETAPYAPGIPSTKLLTNSPLQNWIWGASSDTGGAGIDGYFKRIYSVTHDILGEWDWLGDVLSSTTSLTEGSWQLELKAVDRAGNESASIKSDTLVVDLTPPDAPVLLAPTNNAVVNGSYLLNDWNEVSGAKNYIYESYHNETATRLRFRGEYTNSQKSASRVDESTFWWRVRAVDGAGNVGPWSNLWKVTIDNTAPVLSDKSVFDGWYREPVFSYFDFKDLNMVDDYLAPFCEINGDGTSQSCSVFARVCDKADNCTTQTLSSNPAMIDTTAPLVQLNIWGRTLSGTASDNLSGVDKVELKLSIPGQGESTVLASGTTNWSYTIEDAPLGSYVAEITSFDLAGNKSEVVTKEFEISASDPPPETGGVQGASTQAPSHEEFGVEEEEEKSVKLEDSESEEVVLGEEVLGEEVQAETKPYPWLWIKIGGVFALGFASMLWLSKGRRD